VFRRDGSDLQAELPVGYATMALGGTVEVPLLGGGTESLAIPAGTASGTTLRLRGRGLPSLRGAPGDLRVRVTVEVPGKLPAEERKLIEQLRKLETDRQTKGGRSVFDRMKDAFAG
jgi:molecular chaperone DnaJ